MQQPENLNRVSTNPVDEKVVTMSQQLPCAGNASKAANLGELCQNCSLLREDKVHLGRCARAVCLNVLKNFTPVRSGRLGPNQIHQAGLASFRSEEHTSEL